MHSLRLFVYFTSAVIFAGEAYCEKRVALIIGNSSYEFAGELANPKNDATDIAATLKKLGFQIVDGTDLGKAAMDRKIRDFATSLAGADTALFFYAGHGLQVGGINYLVPIDAQLSTAAALDFEMVRLDLVQRTMEREAKTNVIFLDACRNNPLARNLARAMGTRSADIGRGLAAAESGIGTLISYSTQPGNVALDGDGRNSPYAAALAAQLATPGQDLSTMLINVRTRVMRETADKQVPWEHSALTGRFYFVAEQVAPSPAAAASPQTLSEAAQTWSKIENTTDVAVLDAFATQFSGTVYAALAKQRATGLAKTEQRTPEPGWWDRLLGPADTAPAEPRVAVASPPPSATDGLVGKPAPAPAEQRQAETASTDKAGQQPTVKPNIQAMNAPPTSARPANEADIRGFRDCTACPEMVVVPAGTFEFGSPSSERGRDGDEGPQISVTIAKPFAAGRFEITFAEWDACVADGACAHKPADNGWGREKRPVVDVSWDLVASQFLPWLSRKAGHTYRLLSEAEWEYANRAGTSTAYWWGAEPGRDRANCSGCTARGGKQTLPVGSFKPNAFGLYDTSGNVWEIVQDCWRATHKDAPADGSPSQQGDCTRHVIRGGSWYASANYARSAKRSSDPASYKNFNVGFRVARPL
jgi:uncharacterized caspase-like protein/formylglycine-generating enzyme required for sulfatase activity